MGITKATLVGSAWSALRMALLWARKGGAFRRSDHKSLKSRYLERQFSIDETPAFHFKMHRPASLRWINSCINIPSVDFDDEYDDVDRNFFKWEEEREACDDFEEAEEKCGVGCEVAELEEEEEIDSKAEEFIARFYDQMKMQRQISFL